MVGKEGVEPSQPCGHRILSPACMPFHHLPKEKARVGIEPTYRSFADSCLTTWLSRHKYLLRGTRDRANDRFYVGDVALSRRAAGQFAPDRSYKMSPRRF